MLPVVFEFIQKSAPENPLDGVLVSACSMRAILNLETHTRFGSGGGEDDEGAASLVGIGIVPWLESRLGVSVTSEDCPSLAMTT